MSVDVFLPVRRSGTETYTESSASLRGRYELSQDLLDKQVEMLERKYGGVRARTAALTIQRAFRSHCMQKRFLDLANASKGERRLSRRIHALDLLAQDGGAPLRHHGWSRGSPTPTSEGSQRRVPPQVPRRTSSIPPGGAKESNNAWKRPVGASSTCWLGIEMVGV